MQNRYGEKMTVRLSKLYGMDILTDVGKFVGNAQDFIIDTEAGEVVRILLERLSGSKEELPTIIREKSILIKPNSRKFFRKIIHYHSC